MADSKITALTALTAADPVNDMFPVVDVSDTSMAASGTTKRISANNILSSSPTASGALTVTGLVTAGSATITGALVVDTTTLVANAAGYTDKVGIGTATPAFTLDIQDASFATRVAVTNTNNSAPGAGIYLKTMNGASMVSNATLATANDGTFNLFTGTSADSTKLSINTSGDVNIALGNVVMATSGKGIDFSATASGSGTMTSELLNDYEEGTFTPTVVGSTTAGVGVYSAQVGRYTKIGNLVTVQVYMLWSAHTGTGNMRFGGLPFTTSSDVSSNSAVTIGYAHNIALTAGNILTAYTSTGATFSEANQTPTGGGASTAVPIDTAGEIIYTVSYRV
jgi:hypothetical protein